MKAGILLMTLPLLIEPGYLLADEDGVNGGLHNIRLEISSAEGNTLHLEARHARLAEVLETIATEMKVQMHYASLPEEFVSVKCDGTSVKQIMECLLGADANLIFRYSNGLSKNELNNQPVELWVLNSSFSKEHNFPAETASSQCSSSLDGKNQDKRNGISKPDNGTEQAKTEETARLLKMTIAEDPTQRSQALSQLITQAPADDAAVRKALETALSDADPSVRAQAVFGFARREGAGAADILHAAMHDNDASVRLMAVDSADGDAGLLQSALHDSDAAVRELAAIKLEELADTDKAE